MGVGHPLSRRICNLLVTSRQICNLTAKQHHHRSVGFAIRRLHHQSEVFLHQSDGQATSSTVPSDL